MATKFANYLALFSKHALDYENMPLEKGQNHPKAQEALSQDLQF